MAKMEEAEIGTSASLLQKLDSGLEWLGDKLNPILVKETRQAIKSRQFILWFVLLLIACWLTTIGGVLLIGQSIYYISAGSILMYAYYAILAFPLVVVVPFSAYRSLSSEQEGNTRDLLEVSTLTPKQIINGKLGSAMLQAAVYLSALAPCIAFTYLLRGISSGVIVLLLIYATLASFGLSALGLLLASTSKQKRSQVAISVLFVGILFGAFSMVMGAATGVIQLAASEWQSEGWWQVNATILCVYLTSLGIIYYASVGLTTFISANRSTSIRIAALLQQTVYIAWVATLLLNYRTQSLLRDFMPFALMIGAVYWYLAGSLLVGESPELSHRVRRTLPQSSLGRLFLTWLNPGPSSGYVFAVVNFSCLTILYLAVTYFVPNLPNAYLGLLLWCYFVIYLGIGRLIVYGLRRLTTFSMLGSFLVLLLLILAGTGLPYLIETTTDSIRVSRYPLLQYPSPYWTIDRMVDKLYSDSELITLSISLGSLAIIVLAINLAMASSEAMLMRVAKPKRVQEDDREKNPTPEQKATNPWGDLAQPITVEE